MNVLRFDSATQWTQAISSLWRDRLRLKPDLKICLPSGTTPVDVYSEMSGSVRAGLVSFARSSIFALDEFGGLAEDDPGRTAHTLRRQLIDTVDLPPSSFHVLDPEAADISTHCANYDAMIGDGHVVKFDDPDRQPVRELPLLDRRQAELRRRTRLRRTAAIGRLLR